MKKVLVTGGAGFIGTHLTDKLLQRGYEVRVVDNLVYGNRNDVPIGAEFIQGDILDKALCAEVMQEIDCVFHCAAMSRSAPSLTDIETCTAVNIIGTQNILLAARDAKVKKIIYSGSSTYYGSQPIPHHETHTPSQFLNFYALSKAVGEDYCLLFDRQFNLPCIVLRYFNVYGERQPESGAYALVMGIFLNAKMKGHSLIIHGTGEQRRDFIHVDDVVSANIKAYESEVRGSILNIGSGESVAIKQLADMISDRQIYSEKRLGDADETLADISKAKALLNWAPTVSLATGLSKLMSKYQ